MMKPFGEPDCESELVRLKDVRDDFSSLYFEETPFNAAAVQDETYLIIGRRGAGKTALSQSFAFQKRFGPHFYIDVDEPRTFSQVLAQFGAANQPSEIAIPRLQKIWEYILWALIFEHLRGYSEEINEACRLDPAPKTASGLVAELVNHLIEFFQESEHLATEVVMDRMLAAEQIERARARAMELCRQRPVVLAIDTLEKYDISDDALMYSVAALIQCAARFNLQYSSKGFHVKVFVSGEVYPHLREEVLQNPTKSVKSPVFLLWRPKDLLRLICWRFFRYLTLHEPSGAVNLRDVPWENYRDVYERVWVRFFGRSLVNAFGLEEPTFSYVLRHTQKRPRQLIVMCNTIARIARNEGVFPHFHKIDIREAVLAAEQDLASEVVNSFHTVYPGVPRIIDALIGLPMIFQGNDLDRRASQSASEWPDGTYSPSRFRQLVAELGIVGRIRRLDEEAGYAEADFEYSMIGRLPITHRDQCVIHPMFYSRLNVQRTSDVRVMPFTNNAEMEEANGGF